MLLQSTTYGDDHFGVDSMTRQYYALIEGNRIQSVDLNHANIARP